MENSTLLFVPIINHLVYYCSSSITLSYTFFLFLAYLIWNLTQEPHTQPLGHPYQHACMLPGQPFCTYNWPMVGHILTYLYTLCGICETTNNDTALIMLHLKFAHVMIFLTPSQTLMVQWCQIITFDQLKGSFHGVKFKKILVKNQWLQPVITT